MKKRILVIRIAGPARIAFKLFDRMAKKWGDVTLGEIIEARK